jgi:hypothetical protein
VQPAPRPAILAFFEGGRDAAIGALVPNKSTNALFLEVQSDA